MYRSKEAEGTFVYINSDWFYTSISGVTLFLIHRHPHLTLTYHCTSNSWTKILLWMYTVMESGGHTDTSPWTAVPLSLCHMPTSISWHEEISPASGGWREIWTLTGVGQLFYTVLYSSIMHCYIDVRGQNNWTQKYTVYFPGKLAYEITVVCVFVCMSTHANVCMCVSLISTVVSADKI
jgi:hypothetical protein